MGRKIQGEMKTDLGTFRDTNIPTHAHELIPSPLSHLHLKALLLFSALSIVTLLYLASLL